jgi:vacuolar protein sorting-associated protein 13A/C
MSLTQMGNLDESVRILDDIDMSLSLDSRQSAAQQMTSIDIMSTPIVFRASQRDINLIMAIVTKAAQMAAKPPRPEPRPVIQSTKSASKATSAKTKPARIVMEQPRLVMSKEKVMSFYLQQLVTELRQLKAEFDGFRLVLIGEAHEQPMLHLKTKPFRVNVQDWSADVGLSRYSNGFTYPLSRCMHPPRSLLGSTTGT